MKTETATYAVKRTRLATAPVYLLRFSHVKAAGDATDHPFTRDFASNSVLGATRNPIIALGRPQGNVQTVIPEQGQSSIGTFVFPLLDQAGAILTYMSNPQVALKTSLSGGGGETFVEGKTPLLGYPAQGTIEIQTASVRERIRYTAIDQALKRFTGITRAVDGTSLAAHAMDDVIDNGEQIRPGQRVQLFCGYQDLRETDYLAFGKMEITERGLDDDAVTWLVRCGDIQRWLRQLVFTAASDKPDGTATLGVALAAGGSETTVTATGSLANYPASGVLQVQHERISYGAISGQNLTGCTRGAEGTTKAAHGTGVLLGIVGAKLSLTGNPITLALQIMTSTGLGTNGAYDVLTTYNGLAIPQGLIDVAGLEALRDSEFSGQVYQFSITASDEGKAFIEREVWKTLNCIPFMTQSGLYSAKRIKPAPSPGSVTATLTEDDIIHWSWSDGARLLLNEVEFFYDYDADPENPAAFARRQRYLATSSVSKFGKRPALVIESKGIRTAQGGQAILDDRAFMLFKRHAEPPAVLVLDVFYAKHVYDIGDSVKVTHSKVPNLRTGLRGLTDEIFEVIDLRPFFGAEGKVILTLAWTGAIPLPAAPTASSPASQGIGGGIDSIAPATPVGLVLTPSGDLTSDGIFTPFIDADWTDNSEPDFAYYVVEWRQKPASGDPAWTVAGGSGESRYVLRGLKPGTAYQMRLRAVDDSGNRSGYSATVEATTQTDPGAPTIPTGLALAAFPLAVVASWAANPEADIAGYEVQRAEDAGFTVAVLLRRVDALFLVDKVGDTLTRFYRIRALRRTGSASAYSSATSKAGLPVGEGNLADGSVTSAKIADATITTAKIADAQIVTAKIADLEVTTAKIANLNVTTGKIENFGVNLIASFLNGGGLAFGFGSDVVNYLPLMSVTFSPGNTDFPVRITCQFTLRSDFGAVPFGYVDLRLRRGVVIIWENQRVDTGGGVGEGGYSAPDGTQSQLYTVDAVDRAPSTGSTTWILEGRCEASAPVPPAGIQITASNRYMAVMQAQR